jgi:hypothetical protein
MPEPAVMPTPIPPVIQPVIPPPPPLFPAPDMRTPVSGHHIGIQDLRIKRSIDFSWAAEPGVNTYIITIFQEEANGRRQIIRKEIENRNTWTLDDISILDRGNFIWQLEAVSKNDDSTIERRGIIAENLFTIDIPVPQAPSVSIDERDNP